MFCDGCTGSGSFLPLTTLPGSFPVNYSRISSKALTRLDASLFFLSRLEFFRTARTCYGSNSASNSGRSGSALLTLLRMYSSISFTVFALCGDSDGTWTSFLNLLFKYLSFYFMAYLGSTR